MVLLLGGCVIALYLMPAHLFSCFWWQPWPQWLRSQVKEINVVGTKSIVALLEYRQMNEKARMDNEKPTPTQCICICVCICAHVWRYIHAYLAYACTHSYVDWVIWSLLVMCQLINYSKLCILTDVTEWQTQSDIDTATLKGTENETETERQGG